MQQLGDPLEGMSDLSYKKGQKAFFVVVGAFPPIILEIVSQKLPKMF